MVLKLGNSGDEVKILQSYLKFLDFYEDFPTSHFDKKTEEAVRAFEESFGITVNGIVGENTWKSILLRASEKAWFAAISNSEDAKNQLVSAAKLDLIDAARNEITTAKNDSVSAINTAKSDAVTAAKAEVAKAAAEADRALKEDNDAALQAAIARCGRE